MEENKKMKVTPYDLDGRLELKQAVPLGFQHVLAMFVGNLTPLIIIMGVCGLEQGLRVALLQNAMLIAGLVTLLQLYPIPLGRLGSIGGRLPIVMGTSSGFIGITKAIGISMAGGVAAGTISTSAEAGMYAYGAIMGACLIGGLFEGVLGLFIKPLRKFFPPVVTGTVVIAIGLSLISVGIGFFGGGSSAPDYGSFANLGVGLFTLIMILVFKHCFKGFPSISAILLGIACGYLLSTICGVIFPTGGTLINAKGEAVEVATYAWVTKWSKLSEAAWFAVPDFLPVPLQFNAGAILPMLIMFIVTAVETVGDTSGVTVGGLGREATDKELAGSVICDGIGSAFASLFGVLPNTSFSQNVGLVGMTKVVNRFAIACGAIILCISGLFPKIGAIINIMPQPVLGGAAVIMFTNIIISGIQLVTKDGITTRTATIIAVSLGVGYGIGSVAAVQSFMPTWMTYVFGGSGIVPAALVAIILNIILPKDEKKFEETVKKEL